MRKQWIRNLLSRGPKGFDGAFEVACVPEHDSGHDQVQAARPVSLVLEAAIPKLSQPAQKDRSRERSLGLARCGSPAYLLGLLLRKRLLAAAVGAALPGQEDAFALPLADERSLELGEGAHDGEHECGHGRVLAGEGEALLDELDVDSPEGEHLNEEPVELGPPDVLAGSLVCEDAVDLHVFELALGILVEARDADVSDAVAKQEVLQDWCRCQEGDLCDQASINTDEDSFLTLGAGSL